MSEELKSMHDIDLELICEYFASVERQGPGSPEITLKALSFIDNLNEASKIADIGCGTGGQTLVLAQHAPGTFTGIDLFPRFINILNENAHANNLHHKLKGVVGSMESLPFQKEELDLIWSEGSIYNIGFEEGLKYWRQFLKQGGFIAVSEASWFTTERPAEIENFWMMEYPEIDTIPTKLAQLQVAGYSPVAAFRIPDECWIKHFYEPQVKAQEIYLEKHAGNKAAEEFIARQRFETNLYYKYKAYYGYAFFIGKKM